MKHVLTITALIFIVLWAIGYVGYDLGGLIHVILVMAVIVAILRLFEGKKLI